jgi:hypothetical protein
VIPKDAERFDALGQTLFRNAYRIRSTDVFDLRFLQNSAPVTAFRRDVQALVAAQPAFGEQPPFSRYLAGHLPGEEVFVRRMLFEILERLQFDRHVNIEHTIFFGEKEQRGHKIVTVERLARHWEETRGSSGREQRANADRCLILAFQGGWQSEENARIRVNAVPTILREEIPEEEVKATLAERNEDEQKGCPTIILHDEEDLQRLRLCLLLKEVIALNGDQEHLQLDDFHIGRQIVLPNPEENPGKHYVVDLQVARYFYQTRLYYNAFDRIFGQRLERVHKMLMDAKPPQ